MIKSTKAQDGGPLKRNIGSSSGAERGTSLVHRPGTGAVGTEPTVAARDRVEVLASNSAYALLSRPSPVACVWEKAVPGIEV